MWPKVGPELGHTIGLSVFPAVAEILRGTRGEEEGEDQEREGDEKDNEEEKGSWGPLGASWGLLVASSVIWAIWE